MRIVSRRVVSIVLGLSLAGTAWAVSINTIGGNAVVERTIADTFTGLFMMDTNHPFTADGTVNFWEIWADNTNNVQLVIYRQRHGSFIEVGRSEVVTPTVGYNLFRLEHDTNIRVLAGDFVGAFWPGAGSISFSLDVPEEAPLGLGGCDFTNTPGRLGRTCCSLFPLPPPISLFPVAATTLCGLSRGTPMMKTKSSHRCGMSGAVHHRSLLDR